MDAPWGAYGAFLALNLLRIDALMDAKTGLYLRLIVAIGFLAVYVIVMVSVLGAP